MTAAPTRLTRLTRFYERYGMRGLLILSMLGATISGALLSAGIVISWNRYLGTSRAENVEYLVLVQVVSVTALASVFFASGHVLRDLLSWSGDGRTTARAHEVWQAAITAPRQLAVRGGAALTPMILALYAVWILVATDQPAWVLIPGLAGMAPLIAAFAVFAMLGFELLLRPAIQDIAGYLPAGFDPVAPTLSLRAKVIIPIPGAVMFGVALTTGFIGTSDDYGTRLAIAVSFGLTSAAIAAVLFLLLSHAALDPVDELTEATERVHEGDLTTPVPVLSADELGKLAKSFNHMLEGLREREALREDIRASRARIVATADAERRRMERDLHDGAQQRLVLIKLKLGMLSELIESDPKAATALLNEARADAAHAVDELRDLAHGIYPPLLESDGLTGALEDVADQSSLPVTVETDGIGRYPSATEAAVYFCCLEALQNAAKHAGDSSSVRIQLGEADGRLSFTVTDDGRGFDPARVNGSDGLQNMTDRIGALGGTVRIDSEPGRGTTVTGTIPVTDSSEV